MRLRPKKPILTTDCKHSDYFLFKGFILGTCSYFAADAASFVLDGGIHTKVETFSYYEIFE
jgi:hypothetical protein